MAHRSGAPQFFTTTTFEVELKPDRATLIFTVESRGATAASVEIFPEYVYPGQNQPLRVSGYVARNSVRVEILRLEQAGGTLGD